MRRTLSAVCILLAGIALAGCAAVTKDNPATTSSDVITVKGQLAYRERIALPPGSRARITIVDTAVADRKSPVVARQTIDLADRQVPVPFSIELARANLVPNGRYSLRATIRSNDDELLWTTDTAHIVDTARRVDDLGLLMLKQSSRDTARGVDLPFEARGNEPGWHLTIDADRMRLNWAYGEKQAEAPRPPAVRVDGAWRYQADDAAHDMGALIRDRVCHAASGMPYPQQVTVTIDGAELRGCGGEPQSLLTGTEWVVENIADGGIIDSSRVTLNFDADGRIHGRASCNRYSGDYTITGEQLRIGENTAATMMACAPALNNQENRFLEVLQDARSFDIDPTGKLIIRSQSGPTLEAYPAG